MRGFFFYAALLALVPFTAEAAGDEGVKKDSEPDVLEDRLDSIVVSASRAGKSTPVTYTMVSKENLKASNPINSLPMTLNLQPSVVAVNEGGTGLGYSKMTVRGSKGSQINVTLNGITLNDAESQEVFWVNIPSLSNILSSVQLQRGLGTSANGAGAFGASINMNTASVGSVPHFSTEISGGSFGTLTGTVTASTGLTKSGVYAQGAFNYGRTDGYIRNAKANVLSGMAVLGWMNEKNSLRLTYLVGDQHTGLTWNGISYNSYKTDPRYNSAGEYIDDDGNICYYDNETDNYTQHHVQLNYTRAFEHGVTWSNTANLTKGDGYYENYKTGKKFADYGLDVPTDSEGNQIKRSDFIINKSMDNYYLVYNSDVKYHNDQLDFTGGINLSRYRGYHFGNVLWSKYYGLDYTYPNEWYRNSGIKQEANVYARAEYTPVSWLTAYADLQYRHVSLKMSGPDDDFSPLDYSTKWDFFNPRAGITFHMNGHKAYVSAALGHREPGRSDIKEVIITNNLGGNREELKPEKMLDVEIGYVFSAPNVTASANVYLMEYWDMLLETGRLSDVGYAIKENVGRGWRRGVELAVAWQPSSVLRVDANLTLSTNKIKDYVAYLAEYDNLYDWNFIGHKTTSYSQTTMLMSPSVVANGQISLTPFKNICNNSLKTTTLTLNGKFVGKQYWDNTHSASRCIPSYFVANVALSHEFSLPYGVLGLGAYVNNALNTLYYADAWVYRAYFRAEKYEYQEEGVFPQAPINFMFKVSYSF
ncbi:MAG: TonB-dependent receptor [Candidatus Cryptobacteroides sp.]